ncbi:hypothetical protein GCM10010277_44740 [Streptomyces longisporoflavus]|uniref:hypothetical protein n=1 Tax=Streptomyces longisporoflavus TaxID=28044 RepID=UPI00167DC679|nr:hypothetical protein [Streptomyces longisporoflavus]GGV50147.1 hypothetical protein GCM10010277_44740 [Streptomyces longisporoflavus]
MPVAPHTPKPPAPADNAEEQPTTKTTGAAREAAAEPVFPGLRVLPLGSGLVLIGLGLGFLAVRLRRG